MKKIFSPEPQGNVLELHSHQWTWYGQCVSGAEINEGQNWGRKGNCKVTKRLLRSFEKLGTFQESINYSECYRSRNCRHGRWTLNSIKFNLKFRVIRAKLQQLATSVFENEQNRVYCVCTISPVAASFASPIPTNIARTIIAVPGHRNNKQNVAHCSLRQCLVFITEQTTHVKVYISS